MMKWIIAAGVLFMVYRFFNKQETISTIKKDTKIKLLSNQNNDIYIKIFNIFLIKAQAPF